MVRDSIQAKLPGADAMVPNSVLRVLSDNQGALCHEVLQYLDWLALQLLPDTAETEWLDRHGNIWLVNSDGTTGRKMATLASGTILFTGPIAGTVVPIATQLTGISAGYETTEEITIGVEATNCSIRALDPGVIGNQDPGTFVSLDSDILGVDSTAEVVELTGGVDTENDNNLRARILLRIRQPPMGGDATDYEAWALAVPGVTRAWCSPLEMGIGTVTVRFMMDQLRASNDGFPLPEDIDTVKAYIDTVRPVAVKDFFVVGPIPYPINLRIKWLDIDQASTHAAIIQSLQSEFLFRSKPGQTWYRAWTDEGIMRAPGVNAYDLTASDVVMASNGYMPVLGDVTYGG